MNKSFLPQIDPKNNISSKIIMHFMISVVGFIGTYATIFFGLLLIGGKTGRDSEMRNFVSDSIIYLATHDLFYIVLCIIGVVLLNSYFIYKNVKVVNIREINIDELRNEISFKTQKYYSNNFSTNSYNLNNIKIKESTSTFFMSQKKYNIISFESENKLIGVIDMSDIVWEKEGLMIKELKKELLINVPN